jgi:hypothetical protein
MAAGFVSAQPTEKLARWDRAASGHAERAPDSQRNISCMNPPVGDLASDLAIQSLERRSYESP